MPRTVTMLEDKETVGVSNRWNVEWTVNVQRTAKSCNWHTAQSMLSYTYYSLGSFLTAEVFYYCLVWYVCLAASDIVAGYICLAKWNM